MRKTLITSGLQCFAVAFAGMATATTEDDATAAYGRADYAAAYRTWHELAEICQVQNYKGG